MQYINLNNKTILITGAAGFIGANLTLKLLSLYNNIIIIGIDNMNDYYDVSIKEWRLTQIEKRAKKQKASSWLFIKGSIADKELINQIFTQYKPNIVVNLAAQAGVRYSITSPDAYIESNLIGFYNILEACRNSYDNKYEEEGKADGTESSEDNKRYSGVEHLVYASSSSIYGCNGFVK